MNDSENRRRWITLGEVIAVLALVVSAVFYQMSMRGARPKIETDRPVKPTRLAAQEFEQNLIRWDYGPEGGVLEEGVAETADEAAAEEEARV